MHNHTSHLETCKILHLIESCQNGQALSWMRKLLKEKEAKEPSMECEYLENWNNVLPLVRQDASTLSLPFEMISRFQVLELKNYVLKNTSPYCCSEGSHQNLKTLKLTCVTNRRNPLRDSL